MTVHRTFVIFGPESDLRRVSEVLPAGLSLRRSGDVWRVGGQELDDCESDLEAKARGLEILDFALGAACLRFTDPLDVRLGGLEKWDPSGNPVGVVIMPDPIVADMVVLQDRFDVGPKAARERLPDLAWSLRDNERVQRVMALLGRATSWTMLSNVLDAVFDDYGGADRGRRAVRAKEWVSTRDFDLFYRNANAIEHSASGGRHATERWRLLPRDRFILERGNMIVRTIVTAWLVSRVISSLTGHAMMGACRYPRSPSAPRTA